MGSQLTYPGVYIEEVPSDIRTILGVPTSITVFIGRMKSGPINKPVECLNCTDFEQIFSSDSSLSEMPGAVRLFFENGGRRCFVVGVAHISAAARSRAGTSDGTATVVNPRTAIVSDDQGNCQELIVSDSECSKPLLEDYCEAWTILSRKVDLYNLMVLPMDRDSTEAEVRALWGPASIECQKRRAFLLMDPPQSWRSKADALSGASSVSNLRVGLVKDYSAVFFPRLIIREKGEKCYIGPSGAIAGMIARIDNTRGVWKAPAGTDANIRGVSGLEIMLSNMDIGDLNPRAVNVLRVFPYGICNWGARTMEGDDDFGSEWKYIPMRRLALYIEESLYRGTQWVVFEPNDEPLWAQIRLNVGYFMYKLFRQGAFQGSSKKDAYFVKCDCETTPQNDIDKGVVNILVGFAPIKPAEFIVIKITQMVGKAQT